MTRGDVIVERSAESLEGLAHRAAARHDGFGELISEELDASAKLLRKMKPSLIASRIRRKKEKSEARSSRPGRRRSGPPPMLIVGGALIAGMLLARAINASGDSNGD
jgi:hypothetical protein